MHRVGERQQVQAHSLRTVAHHQPGERVAAGHDGGTGRRGGQQWPDLLGGPGVVKHHQHPLAGEQAAEAGSALGLIAGIPDSGTPSERRKPASASAGPKAVPVS